MKIGLNISDLAIAEHRGAELIRTSAIRPDAQFPKIFADALLPAETGQALEFPIDLDVAAALVVDADRIGTRLEDFSQRRFALAQFAFSAFDIRDVAHEREDVRS
jgi:hypothetical protein